MTSISLRPESARAVEATTSALLAPRATGTLVNDSQAQLNATRVSAVRRPRNIDEVQRIVRAARQTGQALAVCGHRHSMGGQQFAADALLLDLRSMNRVLKFDPSAGHVEVEAGIDWPTLVAWLIHRQREMPAQWTIRQKQTGADRLSIGGALASNIHGRGLALPPLVNDIEAFTLIDAHGEGRRCSRTQHRELFALAIGGYGLFGVVVSVCLRLTPRARVRREVRIIDLDDLMPAFESRIADGFVFGDFQYCTDERGPDFLRRGVFSCYRPLVGRKITDVSNGAPRRFSAARWLDLVHLAHTNRAEAFRVYSDFYLSTHDQTYWSDEAQMSVYVDDYQQELNRRLAAPVKTTDMITELFVPRAALGAFLRDAAGVLRETGVPVIYGTIRLIERDEESFLPWATSNFACVIFNLHTIHSPEGLVRAAEAFRRLIDAAIHHGGTFYVTYHRWARKDQVRTCYPQFVEFLQLKRRHDPREQFQSEWYRHYREMFADQTQRAGSSASARALSAI